MVSLRDLELCPSFAAYTQGASKEALRHIVGVQFRNLATIGGSLCGRFGFSDVLTLLLALDASVVLYKGGEIKLADFAEAGPGSDILTHVSCLRQTGIRPMRRCGSTRQIFPFLPAPFPVRLTKYAAPSALVRQSEGSLYSEGRCRTAGADETARQCRCADLPVQYARFGRVPPRYGRGLVPPAVEAGLGGE